MTIYLSILLLSCKNSMSLCSLKKADNFTFYTAHISTWNFLFAEM